MDTSHRVRSVVFQVPNRIGLGHLNRMACVALALRDAEPSTKILFVVEGDCHRLLETFELPFVNLPHRELTSNETHWRNWSKPSRRRLLRSLSRSILISSGADLVVFDCIPNRAFAEVTRELGLKVVLCIRQVGDIHRYLRNSRLIPVLSMPCPILVPNFREQFQLPPYLDKQATYVGPIVRQIPSFPDREAREEASQRARTIIITSGGGGYPDTLAFLQLAVDAFNHVQTERHDISALLIPGPLFEDWPKLRLYENVRVIPFDPQFLATCASADLVISNAGYNSINELASLGTPTICVPADRDNDDQYQRAKHAAGQYNNFSYFDGKDPLALGKLIRRNLESRFVRERVAMASGATKAARHLLNILNDVSPLSISSPIVSSPTRGKPRVALIGRRLLSEQLNDPMDNLDKSLLTQHVTLIDHPESADYILSLNALPPESLWDRVILLLREPPLPNFTKHYAARSRCHTVITYTPEGPNQFAFSSKPYLFPYRPTKQRIVRASPQLTRRGIYMAGRGGRSAIDILCGGIGLLRARDQMGSYLLSHYPQGHIYGIGWPAGGINTSGSGYRNRKLREIDSTGSDFVICMENIMYPNYISEKLHDGFQSDRLVMYLGEPNVSVWIPAECFFDMRPFFNRETGDLDCVAILDIVRSMSQSQYIETIQNARAWHGSLYQYVDDERRLLTERIIDRITQS